MVVTKLRSQLSVMSGRVWVYLEKAEAALTPLLKSAAEELKQVAQHSKEIFRKLRVSSRGALIVANEQLTRLGSEISSVSSKAMVRARIVANQEITRLGTEVSSASSKAMVRAHIAQATAATLGRAGVDKAHKLGRQSERELHRLGAGCHHAIVATGGKIAGLGSQVSAASKQASKQVALELQKAHSAAIALAKNVADQPRRMRDARRARENNLRRLLADSPDPIVVTDSDKRLVAANEKGLELFGISEFNFGNFTLDTFVPNFDCSGSPLESQGDRGKRCKVRRLDGGLRVAECQFVADIVPHRCLYRFLSVAPYKIAPPEFAKGIASAAPPRTVKGPTNPGPTTAAPAQKASRHGARPGL
jgi:PAS domain-containing protein